METEGTTGLFILMRQSEGQEETTESTGGGEGGGGSLKLIYKTQKANNLHKLT